MENKAIVYVRARKMPRHCDEPTLADQLAEFKDVAAKNGMSVVSEYKSVGGTAAETEMLSKLLEEMEETGVKTVMIKKTLHNDEIVKQVEARGGVVVEV